MISYLFSEGSGLDGSACHWQQIVIDAPGGHPVKHHYMLHQGSDSPERTALQNEGFRPVNTSMQVCRGIECKAKRDRANFRQGPVNGNDATGIRICYGGADRSSVMASMNVLKMELIWRQSGDI